MKHTYASLFHLLNTTKHQDSYRTNKKTLKGGEMTDKMDPAVLEQQLSDEFPEVFLLCGVYFCFVLYCFVFVFA